MYKGRCHLLRRGNTRRQVDLEGRPTESVTPVTARELLVQHTGLKYKRGLD